jgi:hypothetical protein
MVMVSPTAKPTVDRLVVVVSAPCRPLTVGRMPARRAVVAAEGADAVVGRLERLDGGADAVQQVGDVGGARVEHRRREEVAGIVEGGVDLLAGGQAVLRAVAQVRGVHQRKQVATNAFRKDDIAHSDVPGRAPTILAEPSSWPQSGLLTLIKG